MVKYELKKIQTEFPEVKVTSSTTAYQVIKQFYGDDIEIYESCFILLLNQANITIGYAKISQGGISGTVVDPRLICKYAIETLSAGVILAHNHPSGNLKPSDADIELTNKVRKSLEILGCKLVDSMIVTTNDYASI